LDSYIKIIDTNIENRNEISVEVNDILKNDKSEELIFLQVKTILEKNKEIYIKKLKILSEELKKEQKKKDILKASIELGQEIPVIIKQIEKEVPLFQKISSFFNFKILNKLDNNENN
jgi:hypothetical protein